MKKVLCVCIGNTCRSPMMQVLLQKELGKDFLVESAGLKESSGKPANEHSVLCMKEKGFDLSHHKSRWIGELDLATFSYVICVGENEAEQVIKFLDGGKGPKVIVANQDGGGIPNPYGMGLFAYRECLYLLMCIMPKIAEELL